MIFVNSYRLQVTFLEKELVTVAVTQKTTITIN